MSISSTISLVDRVTAPIQRILGSTNKLTQGFEKLDNQANKTLADVKQEEIISASLDRIANGLQEATNKQKKFNQTVQQGEFNIENLAKKIGGMISAYMAFDTVVSNIKKGIEYASDLNEVQNVVDVTFQDSAQTVNEWSQQALKAYGLNEVTAKRFAGTMGAMLKSSGLAGNGVVKLSTDLAGLAGDMASFYNLPIEQAFEKIRSGISGETEPLKAIGVNMSVANMEAFALAKGIGKAYSQMSQAEQVMLRYNYLMAVTKDSQGDFARTLETSYANQKRVLEETWVQFMGKVTESALPSLTKAFNTLNSTIEFLNRNWAFIAPVLQFVLELLGVYLIQAYAITVATKAWAMAQSILNAVMNMNPIARVITAIFLVIAVIQIAVSAFNRMTNSAVSASGVICGSFAVAGAIIYNIVIGLINGIIQYLWAFANIFLSVVEWILNVCNGGFESFGDAVANLIGQIINMFLQLGKIVTKIIDAIFGQNWSGAIDELSNKVLAWGKKNEKAINMKINPDETMFERMEYGKAYNAGYKWGDDTQKKLDAMVNTNSGNANAESLADNVGKIADNTGALKDSVDISNENLKYMKDIAEREAINRFTTAEIKVDMNNTNNVSSNYDVADMIRTLADGVRNAMGEVAEGVHA